MALGINIHQAKTHLSRLLEQALTGEDVVIMKAGKPLVRLTPVAAAPVKRKIGTARGDFTVPDDFDASLPDRVLGEFEKARSWSTRTFFFGRLRAVRSFPVNTARCGWTKPTSCA
jgi:prevent-host-death family protein